MPRFRGESSTSPPSSKAFRTARDGACELPESEVFARFVDGAAAFEVAQQGLVAVGCDALEQQPPDRAAALLGNEDVQ